MQLLNLKKNDEIRIGVKTQKGILDLQEAGEKLDKQVPLTMEQLIEENNISKLSDIVEEAEQKSDEFDFMAEEDITFAPVVNNPEKILCVGLNYLEHIEEAESEEIPDEPVIFSKFNNSLAAHNEHIPVPETGSQFDYEVELAIIMGKEAKNVSKEEALYYVFGYSVSNDLSVRDLQFKSGRQWLLGKTADKFAPVGPYLVTADRVEPSNLDISLKRNGETVQSSHTKYMIFDCATIISYLSKHMTLKPGDLIMTGTPEGVILGYPEGDRHWLKEGDELEAYVEGVGALKNTFGES